MELLDKLENIIFGKKEKKPVNYAPVTYTQNPTIKRFDYISTKHFKGYKRVHIVSYGFKDCQIGILNLLKKHGNELYDLPVTLFVRKYDKKNKYIEIYVDDCKVGCMYDNNIYFNDIISGKAEAIHIFNKDGSHISAHIKFLG